MKLEKGSLKISASTVSDVDSVLGSLAKYEKKLGVLHVTKAQHAPKAPKKTSKKKSDK